MEDSVHRGGLFSRRSDRSAAEHKWPILRTPANRPLVGTCLSSDLLCCKVHYFRGRSTPCLKGIADCDACSLTKARNKLYIAAAKVGKFDRAIIEMTDAVEASWDEAFCLYRTLRGTIFELSRRPQRPNGQLFLRTKPRLDDLDCVPKPPSLEDMLLRMWEVPEALRAAGLLPLSINAAREAKQRKLG